MVLAKLGLAKVGDAFKVGVGQSWCWPKMVWPKIAKHDGQTWFWPKLVTPSKVGVLSRRGYAVESAVAQICREGGARVSTNVMVRDLHISQGNSDSCVNACVSK